MNFLSFGSNTLTIIKAGNKYQDTSTQFVWRGLKTSMHGSTTKEIEALYTQGKRYLQFGELTTAEEFILKGISLDISYAPLWNLMALVHQGRGDFEKACEFFKEAISKAPKWREPIENKGILEFSKKEYKSAIRTHKKYMEMGGEEIEVLLTLVEAAFKVEDCNTVLSVTKTINDIDDDFREVWEMRGICQARQGQFNAAITSLNVAIALNPEAKGALNAVGNLCYESENYEKAVEFYESSLEVDKFQAVTLFRHGTALWFLKRWGDAIEYLEIYTRLVPKDPKGWNNLGVVLREKGEIKRAVECYQKALQLDPDFEVAKQNQDTAMYKQVVT